MNRFSEIYQTKFDFDDTYRCMTNIDNSRSSDITNNLGIQQQKLD